MKGDTNMYSNYNSFPISSMPNVRNTDVGNMATSNSSYMPQNGINTYKGQSPVSYNADQNMGTNDERFVPFLAPFLLGGITGGLLAPAFYGPRYGNQVYYNNYYPYPPYPPYYGPYYR